MSTEVCFTTMLMLFFC